MADKSYKILSLDGGGSWALIQTIALADIYGLDTKGKDILDHFNLAIANSGGSIVLAGLLMDMTPRQLFDLFDMESIRKGIFDKKFITLMGFRKYKTESKIVGLQDAFNGYPVETQLTDIPNTLKIKTDIVIPAFDYDRERATFFRSNANSKAGGATNITIIQAVHASSTAPVKYFDDPAMILRHRFWDGAVGGYNNPIMAGVTEVLANRSATREEIGILSIGTGNNFLPLWIPGKLNNGLYKPPLDPGLINDVTLVARAILSDPPDAASYIAYVMLGGDLPNEGEINSDGPIVRMNPLIQPKGSLGNWSFPNGLSEADFTRLTELELDAIETDDVNLIKAYFSLATR